MQCPQALHCDGLAANAKRLPASSFLTANTLCLHRFAQAPHPTHLSASTHRTNRFALRHRKQTTMTRTHTTANLINPVSTPYYIYVFLYDIQPTFPALYIYIDNSAEEIF